MAIKTSVTRQFDNNYVQVEVKAPRTEPIYYKLPASNARAFQKEYKSNIKKNKWTNFGLITGALAVILVPLHFISKKIESRPLKTTASIIAGVIGGVGSMYFGSVIESKNYRKLMQKYNAEEIDYSQPNLDIIN